jgi:hypothetical protein
LKGDNKQVGGADSNDQTADKKYDEKYTIPEYKEPTNNPMIPNEQRRIYKEREQKVRETNANQILNLQLYQPPAKKPRVPSVPNPAVFYPNYVPNPFDPIAYANYMQSVGYSMQQPAPVYKEYNINIGGISGSHIKTALFFEDALPVKNVSGTFNSISERITMYESIKANLFASGDGKDVPIENDSYNLLSHLKLMDMNPYNTSRFSRNPYKGLAFGFLLYRSCYPMRRDMRSASAICAPNSTGINVRIYRLTEGAYMVQKITKACDYDEWREMAFYNYIKEHIVKSNVSPNFTIMYGYNIALNSNINFDELKMIQNPNRDSQSRMTDVSQFSSKNWGLNTNTNTNLKSNVNASNFNQALQNLRAVNTYDKSLPSNTIVPVGPTNLTGDLKQTIAFVRDPKTGLVLKEITNVPTPQEQAILLNKYSGKALVCLTEASNYNILGWARKEYRADGNVKMMINSGYHTRVVWESVIFQMLVALYVMQLKGIIINGFKIDRNVFIKDINIGGNVTNFWKYKVEGVEYYIPNYGYLVLIDSNFRDFEEKCTDAMDPNHSHKIEGLFLDDCKLSQEQIIEKTFEMFRTAIDPNIFGSQDFINDGGVKPPEEILRLLNNIKNVADTKPTMNIAYYIRTFMTMFLNNRVGSALAEGESNNVKRGAIKEFRKGQIVVMTDSDGIDKFVVHVKQKQGGISRIITKDKLDPATANIIEKDVATSSLNEYSVVEPIRQTFNINTVNLTEENLLETYNVE